MSHGSIFRPRNLHDHNVHTHPSAPSFATGPAPCSRSPRRSPQSPGSR
jgi:hypothetical protein